METAAIYPGRYEWMEMMSQMRGQRSREEVILPQVVWKTCFNGNDFGKPGFVSTAVIEMYHMPILSLKSFINSSPAVTFLHHSVN